MNERNRAAEFAAIQAADEKKRADLDWVKGGEGRRLVDGQRVEAESAPAPASAERPPEARPAPETPAEAERRKQKEDKMNGWIKESHDTLRQWTAEYAKITQGGFLDRNGAPDYKAYDPDFIDRVQEQLETFPSEPPLTGRETAQELVARATRQRAKELVAAARVLDGIQRTIEDNVKQWKAEGLQVIEDSADWKKVA